MVASCGIWTANPLVVQVLSSPWATWAKFICGHTLRHGGKSQYEVTMALVEYKLNLKVWFGLFGRDLGRCWRGAGLAVGGGPRRNGINLSCMGGVGANKFLAAITKEFILVAEFRKLYVTS